MLAIVVSRAEEPRWRRTYAVTAVNIGHRADNQLVLDEASADARHARIVVRDGRVIVVDLKSACGTFVGGKRLGSPRVIRPRDLIAIGAYTLSAFLVDPQPLAAYPCSGPLERELLDAIAAGDEASRLVYADWLEGQGDPARAELLRLQHALDAMSPRAPSFERATDRLRQLAADVDLAWRSRIATRPIEGCPASDLACPKQWAALIPTEREAVRRCGACDQDVTYCASVPEAREHVARGARVALDVTSARWPLDLAGPYGEHLCERCRIDVGSELERCPRCGGVPTGREDDPAMRRSLFQQYQGIVARYFRNKVSAAEQRDLVQRTFLAYVASGVEARGTATVRTYLLQLAHQALIAYRREAGHRAAHGPEDAHDAFAFAASTPDLAVARRQEHRILLAALRRLPLQLQAALELRYWEGLNNREIAAVLGVPLGTVMTRLRDGQIRLRAELMRDDVAPQLLRSVTGTLESWAERVRGGLDIVGDD